MVFHRDVCAFGFGGKPCRKLRVDPPPPPPAQTTSPSNSWNASWAAFGSQHECCPHFAVSSQFFFFFLNQLAVCSLSLSLSERSHGLITGTSPAARGAGAHHQHELHTHVVLPGHRERCFASAKTPYCDDGLWPLHRCDAGWDREQCGWIKTRSKQLWWEVAWDCGTQYQRRRTACGADRTNALRPFYTRKGPCAPVGWQYVRYTFSLNHLFFLLLRAVTPATPKSSTLWVCFRTGLLPSTPSPPITQRTSQAATRNTGQCRQGSEEKTKADVALHFLLLFFCWLFPPMWIINTLE